MKRFRPKRAARAGRTAGRGGSRSTIDRPVYHTYLMEKRGTLFITDIIPRSEHGPFFEPFRQAWDAGGGVVHFEGTPWGLLIMHVYRKSNTAYVETEAQFKHVLRQLGNRNN